MGGSAQTEEAMMDYVDEQVGACCPDAAKDQELSDEEKAAWLVLRLAEIRDEIGVLAKTAPNMPLKRAYRASLHEAARAAQGAINHLKEAEGFYGVG